MKRSINSVLVGALLFSALSKAEQTQNTFNLTKVASGFYVHKGENIPITEIGEDDIANIGFIVGNRCVAVIDTGNSITTGEQLYNSIRSVSSLPICYIINTHVHLDHIMGNIAFLKEKPEYVGHYKLPEIISANKNYYPEKRDYFVSPTLIVESELSLDLGDRTIKVQAHRSAHTNHDLSIYDNQTDTLWLGDLLFMGRTPRIYGSINGWIQVLEQFRKASFTRVIPGHGPIQAGWPQASNYLLSYLVTLRQDVRSAIREGRFLEETIKSAGQSEKSHWHFFDLNNEHNVSRAYSELEWE